MPLINCTECGKQVSTDAKACPNCGHPVAKMQASLPVTNVKCGHCRKDVASNLDLCPYCHMPIAQSSTNTSTISWALIILSSITSVYFLAYKTSVYTSSGDVSNFELMQNRQLGLIVGIALVIVGVILFAISKKSD
jgi:RNA polymerase subunit RPABC4/transcription elongation factor Spt4